jgi:hypothetical protein
MTGNGSNSNIAYAKNTFEPTQGGNSQRKMPSLTPAGRATAAIHSPRTTCVNPTRPYAAAFPFLGQELLTQQGKQNLASEGPRQTLAPFIAPGVAQETIPAQTIQSDGQMYICTRNNFTSQTQSRPATANTNSLIHRTALCLCDRL